MASLSGMGKLSKQMGQMDLEGNVIKDEYGMDREIDIYAKDDEDDVKDGENGFLKVFKKSENLKEEKEEPMGEVKTRRQEDEDIDLKVPSSATGGDGEKPMI